MARINYGQLPMPGSMRTFGGIGGPLPPVVAAGTSTVATPPGGAPTAPAAPAAAAPQKWWQRVFGPQVPGLDPNLQQQLARQAMFKTGLGLLSSGSRGRPFGQGVADAFGSAMNDVNAIAQQAYQNQVITTQAQQQQAAREADEKRAQAEEERRAAEFERETAELERIERAFGNVSDAVNSQDPNAARAALGQAAVAMRNPALAAQIIMPDENQSSYTQMRKDYELAREQGYGGSFMQFRNDWMKDEAAPSGYRWTETESGERALEPVPGGPADPTGPSARTKSMQLRKEYEDQDVVKTYRTVLPLYHRAASAPDNRAGDISVIYALGKMFDPTSVVREGELQLSMDAAPWLQKLAAGINSQITGEGRLTPAMRSDIMQALNGQVEALRAPYAQERQRYSTYATDSGMTADSVVGPDPAEAFRPRGGGGALPQGVSEEDVAYTMQVHGLTREEVLQRLGNAP